MTTITDLKQTIKGLSKTQQELFDRIFTVRTVIGTFSAPKAMHPWLTKTFGGVNKAAKQKIVNVTNTVMAEGTLFNELRTKRPIISSTTDHGKKKIEESFGRHFCHPVTSTPADVFGRIKGKQSITASNVAMYSSPHSLVIFKEHNPLTTKKEAFIDHFTTGLKWFKKIHKENPKADHPYLMWNCLWRAASSIVHGHFQVICNVGEHFVRIEYYNEISGVYKELFGTSYWDDLYKVHKSIGLAKKYQGVKLISSLTPLKEKEVLVISDVADERFMAACYKVYNTYIKKLGVESFNMGVYLQPLSKRADWHLPVIARFVDRGALNTDTSDIGGMEMFTGHIVVGTDPYAVFSKL